MESSYSRELPYPFVVGPDELKKLERLLTNKIAAPKIWADCADDVQRSFKSVADLTKYENTRPKAISRVRLSSRTDRFDKSASITLSGLRPPIGGISIAIEGRDDVVCRLRDEILGVLDATQPWYGPCQRFSFVNVLFIVGLVASLGVLTIDHLGWWPSAPQAPERGDSTKAFYWTLSMFLVAALMGISLALDRVRDRVFPFAVFRIGQGDARFKRQRTIRKILIGFATSLAVGLVSVIWTI